MKIINMMNNKVALITGSSRGIGKAIALKLAEEGADVIVTYNKNEDKAQSVVDEIKAKGREAVAFQCDVSREEDIDRLVTEVAKVFPKIDILVNNAGVAECARLLNDTMENVRHNFDVNVFGLYYLTQKIVPLINKGGTILNISSIRYCTPHPTSIAYSASKAAVSNLTEAMAKELGPDIQVNAVAPGFVMTDMTAGLSEERKEQLIEKTPLKRFATVEDIANAVYFFCSPLGECITGQTLIVDGGETLRN